MRHRFNTRRRIVLLVTLAVAGTVVLVVTAGTTSASVVTNPVESTAYLTNPDIGWQRMPVSESNFLPETVAYRRPEYNWAQMNPQPGLYDFSRLEKDLAAARFAGKQLSFRIYTMRGDGDQKVPQWVLDRGAVLFHGAPDYSDCAYQDLWGDFVQELRARYDGRPGVAWIDISGYGNFNEWSWHDDQTTYESDYLHPTTLDGHARIRLADTFIGGSGSRPCRAADGTTKTASYNYPGFKTTQLVMPFAGIAQASRYVAGRRSDIGIRHDCLGDKPHTDTMMSKIGDVIEATWRRAPVIYEFCAGTGSDAGMTRDADSILKWTHGTAVHDNLTGARDVAALTTLMRDVGYRYVISRASYDYRVAAGGVLPVGMTWLNRGYAPSYPRMGQSFELRLALVTANGAVAKEWPLDTPVSGWQPAVTIPGTPPANDVAADLKIPATMAPGSYTLSVSIVDQASGRPINLASGQPDASGRTPLGTVSVTRSTTSTTSRPAPPPTPATTTTSSTTTTEPPSTTSTTDPATTTSTSVPPPNPDLVGNGSFETGTGGWSPWHGSASVVETADAPDGSYVERVRRTGGASFTIDDSRNTVISCTQGVIYRATAWARAASDSSVEKLVSLRSREFTPSGRRTAETIGPELALTTSFRQISLEITCAATGDGIDLRVSQQRATQGDAFEVDGIQMFARE